MVNPSFGACHVPSPLFLGTRWNSIFHLVLFSAGSSQPSAECAPEGAHPRWRLAARREVFPVATQTLNLSCPLLFGGSHESRRITFFCGRP